MSTTPPPPSNIASLLDRARRELLDLSTRNRLLSMPVGAKSARLIEVHDELTEPTFRMLATERRVFGFLPGTPPGSGERAPRAEMRAGGPTRSADAADDEELADLPPPEEDDSPSAAPGGLASTPVRPIGSSLPVGPGGTAPVLPRAEASSKAVDEPGAATPVPPRLPARRHVDARLQTSLMPEALQRRLLDLYRDARTMIEEQGVNILYLALGQLKWQDPAEPGVFRHAPLILVPVELERRSASDRFQLSRREEEIQDNLSLAAKLKADFGVTLPEIGDEEEFQPAAFLAKVAAAAREQEGWEVLPDAMVLGFFSFAKFLMYRDLDPGNWPDAARLTSHPLIRGLMQDGFPGADAAVPEEAHLDELIPVARLDHVVDADGSQTLAIEAVRQGRSVVIQGPPGTGKSQSITNLIATAVLDGKTVLFVAEKLAALEVVKRRLEKEGLGPLCLELHSNKASKRAVVEEIGATWKLGKPRAVDGDAGLVRLEELRRLLNAHVQDLHAPHGASGIVPFRVLGELLLMGDRGRLDSDAEPSFDGLESWTLEEHEERRRLVGELATRVAQIGVPARHPWRGVRREQVQKLDHAPLATRIRGAVARIEALLAAARAAEAAWRPASEPTLAGWDACCRELEHAGVAPAGMDRARLVDPAWEAVKGGISVLVTHGSGFEERARKLADRVVEEAWRKDYTALRGVLAEHGQSWWRFMNGEFRRAMAELRVGCRGVPPSSHEARLELVNEIILGQGFLRHVLEGDALGRAALGKVWNAERTSWSLASAIVDWVERARNEGWGAEFRQRFSAIPESTALGPVAERLRSAWRAAHAELEALGTELDLDWDRAFDGTGGGLGAVVLESLRERLTAWLGRMEDLAAWCQFHGRAQKARAAGLGALVDRLDSGEVAASAAGDVFERAWRIQWLRDVFRQRPDLAAFDGILHDGRVEEFRRLDRERLGIARHRTLAAHHGKLPPLNSGVGAAGIVRGELERKRGHRAVRRLLRDAGSVVQAVKPVFMMSPLSVAQYLEPGAVEFDLLVIDEASQVQPVDALGAIARCRQLVVVGDSRQLPPTRFFARMTSSEPAEGEGPEGSAEAGAAEARDIESILGLCCARGLPQRMLRWHYRSRHHSLIAVSNREFYDNRLFIVPSPYAAEAGSGLKFHHVPEGVFDSGGSGSNRVEAKVVCRAILRHARETPQLSLGVAAFSVRQQQAILDELELLRREHPDTEPFFTGHATEPFFVKNLENVQGDERDVIHISVGYGRDVHGTLAMRFGPLAMEGGERRLNVLISRAKRRCEVFSSITADEIDLARSGGRGVAALKAFLGFAQTGRLESGPAEATESADAVAFESAVRVAVEGLGYEVRTRVGIAGFFIDLAVIDPERRDEGRFLLGIELDGPGYAMARSARDRDRLRPAVLGDHGWLLYRVWSADWFQRPEEQLRKLAAVLVQAREASRAAVEAEKTKEVPGEDLAVPRSAGTATDAPGDSEIEREEVVAGPESTAAGSLAVPYREARFEVPRDAEPHLLPVRTLAGVLARIVEIEGPVHEDELVTRVRSLWDLGRAGARVQDAVAKATRELVVSRECVREEGFLMKPGAPMAIRNRAEVASANLRKPEFLPPSELREAVVAVVKAHHGARRDEVPVAVARLLGFRSTSPGLRRVIGEQLAVLLRDGALTESEGMVRALKSNGGNGLT